MNRKDFVTENTFNNKITDKHGKERKYPRILFPYLEPDTEQLYTFIFIGLLDKVKCDNLLKGYERWICESGMEFECLKFKLSKGMLFEFDLPAKSFIDQVHNYRLSHNMDIFYSNKPYRAEFYRFKNQSFVFKSIKIVSEYVYKE